MSLPDSLRDALGQVISRERSEWRREREAIQAEARAAIAEMREQHAARVAELETMVAGILANVRDGKDGEAGPKGEAGERGPEGPPAPSEQIAAEVARYLTENPPAPGKDGADGQPGERGPEGTAGKLPVVRTWADAVHYEGDVVAHAGGTWQAVRDTGRAPPHDDWLCIAAAGADGAAGRLPDFRGAWAEGSEYRALDVVMVGGSSFVAINDAPGQCPGEGWRLFAAAGTKGRPGERGPAGPQGERGMPGPAVVRHHIDAEGMLSTVNGDGSVVNLDLYPILSKIAHA